MSTEPASPFLATAIDAVLKAGEIQLKHLGSDFQVTAKEGTDIVTAVDLEVEATVRAMIAGRFPGHGILAEETAEKRPSAGVAYRWLFDPIDGTVNYAHGLPIFCASLALEVNGTVEVAAVYDPSRRELFTSERGRGAALNSRPIRVSRVDRLGRAAIGAGFPHGASTRVEAMEQIFCEAAVRASAIRRLGSAALDLCNVACGRLDGFWDANLKPWDTAAGALLVQEAGGTVTSLNGGAFSCFSGEVLASNGSLHGELSELVRRHS
jgi:myo-inositol-1(or 4)-monophosphatase